MQRLLFCFMLLLTLCACGITQNPEPTTSPLVTITPDCAEPTPSTENDWFGMTVEQRIVARAEELMHYAKDEPITVELLNQTTFGDRHFALLFVRNDWHDYFMAEYDSEGNILAWSTNAGSIAVSATTGYWPMYITYGDTKLCWVQLPDERTATSEDGTQILEARQDNDYTAIRFTMADGSTVDTPVIIDKNQNLAVQLFDEWPVSAVPIVENTAVTAFEMTFSEVYNAHTD